MFTCLEARFVEARFVTDLVDRLVPGLALRQTLRFRDLRAGYLPRLVEGWFPHHTRGMGSLVPSGKLEELIAILLAHNREAYRHMKADTDHQKNALRERADSRTD